MCGATARCCSSLRWLSSSLCWLILSFAVLSNWLCLFLIVGSRFAVSRLLSGRRFVISRFLCSWGTCSSCRLLSSGFCFVFLGLLDSLSLFLGSLCVCCSLFPGVSCLLFLFLTCFQVGLGLGNLLLGLLKSCLALFEQVLEA